MDKLTRFFEIIIEVFSVIKIVASLFILGIFLGIVCYALKTDTIGLILGILIALAGLISGIFLAFGKKKWQRIRIQFKN